jgi:hypothetical protein
MASKIAKVWPLIPLALLAVFGVVFALDPASCKGAGGPVCLQTGFTRGLLRERCRPDRSYDGDRVAIMGW